MGPLHRILLPVLSALALAAAPTPGAFAGLKFRNLGPFRGGRVGAVAGVPGQPQRYYMGATGGGLWRTEDGGASWRNLSDGYFRTGSVGAIGLCDGDPNVIYVGMGEDTIRGNVSRGDGVYRSTDAGRTPRPGAKRQAFGEDPLQSPAVSRHMRSAIDGVIDSLASRKDAGQR